MFVVLYSPENADPEVFGPYQTPQQALNVLRRISGAAGQVVDITHSALLATIDVSIDGERHRYQVLKLGSSNQADVHAELILELRASARINVELRPDREPPSSPLSGY